MKLDQESYSNFKVDTIQGRYVTNEKLLDFVSTLGTNCTVETLGASVQKRSILGVRLGTGKSKILMWSQMHGNESTTTKAVVDLLNFLSADLPETKALLQKCTIQIIPILNPDGAEAYTRVNANKVDLNRDAQVRSQPESKLLREVYEAFQPHFCFNLHDQRTIFNVGDTPMPATVSFLAPAADAERSISASRTISMQLITAMSERLQELIPGQVGRYDDTFNANCIGDTFQMLGTPTILFEAGHFPDDYEREKTRIYIFHALLTAINCIGFEKVSDYNADDYFKIPENNKLFFDVILKHANALGKTDAYEIHILFKEVLKKDQICFEPHIEKVENSQKYFGHRTYDCTNKADVQELKSLKVWDLL